MDAAGDALLRRVGGIIMGNIRAVDFAARLGGDSSPSCFPRPTLDRRAPYFPSYQRLLTETMKKNDGP